MPQQIIIDNDFVTLWYHSEKKIVHHKFNKKTIYGSFLRDVLNKGAELLKENNACKWLSDDRSNIVFAPDDAQWGVSDWFPRAVAAGWKYWAILRPIDEIGKMNIEQFTSEYSKKGIVVEFFEDENKAIDWLNKL